MTSLGDFRFQPPYDKLKEAMRPAEILRSMSSEDVIAALAAASREKDPYLANVLATEALNRVSREGAAIESLGQGVYIVDRDARVVYINRAATILIDRTEAEVLGRPVREVIGLKDVTIGAGDDHGPEALALAKGHAVDSEEGVLSRDHREMLVAYSAVPMRRDDAVTGVVVAFRDITGRRRTQQALAQSEARLRRLLETIPDAILVLDPAGRVRYSNPAAHDLFGRTAQELLGASLGVPSESAMGAEVDVSDAGGTWRLARQRTIPFEWEDAPAFLSIYSEIQDGAT